MSDTEWFERRVGDNANIRSKELPEGGFMVLVGCTVPDWVRCPSDLPGFPARTPIRVLGEKNYKCPMCKNKMHRGLQLEGGLCCIECPAQGERGFLWCRADGD